MRRTNMSTKKKATRVVVGLLVGMSVFTMMGCSSKASAKTSNDISSCQEFIDDEGVDQTDYLAFAGNFCDSSEYGASCTITEGKDHHSADVGICINTMDQNNGTDYEEWKMTVTCDPETDQLNYKDCTCTTYKDQKVVETKNYGAGYFQLDSKSDVTKFTWAGANKSKYAKCSFSPVDENATAGNSDC